MNTFKTCLPLPTGSHIPEIPGKRAGLLERILALYVQLNTQKPVPPGPAPGLKGRMRNKRNPKTGRKYKYEISK